MLWTLEERRIFSIDDRLVISPDFTFHVTPEDRIKLRYSVYRGKGHLRNGEDFDFFSYGRYPREGAFNGDLAFGELMARLNDPDKYDDAFWLSNGNAGLMLVSRKGGQLDEFGNDPAPDEFCDAINRFCRSMPGFKEVENGELGESDLRRVRTVLRNRGIEVSEDDLLRMFIKYFAETSLADN